MTDPTADATDAVSSATNAEGHGEAGHGEAGHDEAGHDDGHSGAGHDEGHGDDHHGPTGWRYWLYTTDHKVIGVIYLWHAVVAFALGGALALIFRTELATPELFMLSLGGYNASISIHGLTMIFFVILPLQGAFFNYMIPLFIGADEMAWPRMNALGAWGISAGLALLYLPFLLNLLGLTGLPDNAGWFAYPPLRSMLNTSGTDFTIMAIWVLGVASLTGGGVNFFVTILNERKPSLDWFDLPIWIWTVMFTNVLAIFSLPWLIDAWSMVWLERNLGMAFFDARMGGDPLLYQWIWWTFGHPEVYVLVLPGMGIAAEVISRFSERPIYGYKPLIAAFTLVSVASLGVWAHHMYATGLAASRYAFMVFSMVIAVGFGVYIYSMVATMWKGRIHLTTPVLFSIGVVIGLVYSGMDGFFFGQPATDLEFHSTYFVVGHFHFTIVAVGLFGLLAGVYYWFPKMTGRMYNTRLAKFHAFTTIVGMFGLFFMMAMLGDGTAPGADGSMMMRRYATYTYAPGLQLGHIITTGFAFLVGIGQLAFFWNLIASWRRGTEHANPWDDLLGGQDMPSPEWDGFPYEPPTPTLLVDRSDGSGEGVAADGGPEPDAVPDGGSDPPTGPEDGESGDVTAGGSDTGRGGEH